jgi:excisionase family DNA binding protein
VPFSFRPSNIIVLAITHGNVIVRPCDEDDDMALRSTPEAAKRLNLADSTLEKMRVSGRGPKFIRLGRVVRYDDEDLDAFIQAGRRASTSDSGPLRKHDQHRQRAAGATT